MTTDNDAAAVLALLDADSEIQPSWSLRRTQMAADEYRAALRRIAEKHAPGPEPWRTRNPDWMTRAAESAEHAEWRTRAAILADIRAALEGRE